MTGQSLLDTMELLNQELQLQTSEADTVRGLLALNLAQDWFETLAAREGHFKEDTTTTITPTADTETTTFPSGFLRVDRLQFLDTNGKPTYDLDNIMETGGHINVSAWPLVLVSSAASTGAPTAYYTNGRNVYWSPTPDQTYTDRVRVYGFKHADDITASGTFAYDDSLRLPFASFAVELLKIGVGDGADDVEKIAVKSLSPAIEALVGTVRDGANGFVYRYRHDT